MHGVDRSLNPRLTDVFDIIFFFAHKTTIMVVTKVPVHELDKKSNKLTLAHKRNRPLHTQHNKIKSVSQSIT